MRLDLALDGRFGAEVEGDLGVGALLDAVVGAEAAALVVFGLQAALFRPRRLRAEAAKIKQEASWPTE